jgi:putative transposase
MPDEWRSRATVRLAGEGVDLIRDAVQLVLQELIELEATEAIGADRYERSDTRVTERNGARPRLLTTRAGDVELHIPELRKGSFFPSILEPGDGSIRRCTRR